MAARKKNPGAGKAVTRESAGRAKTGKSNGSGGAALAKPYCMRLYVAGQTSRSTAAIANLKKICEEHLAGRYAIEVIDLLKTPQLARDHQILAIPTLIRELPEPLKRVIGDLSNTERTLVGLDLRAGA